MSWTRGHHYSGHFCPEIHIFLNFWPFWCCFTSERIVNEIVIWVGSLMLIFHLFSVPTSLKVFFHRYDFIVTSAEGLGLGIIFWWNSNICNRWVLGPPIFRKIIPKHARSALGCDRLQNFDHVAPLHGYRKKLGVEAIYIRHFLKLFPAIRPPPISFLIFFENLHHPFLGQITDQLLPNLYHGCTHIASFIVEGGGRDFWMI